MKDFVIFTDSCSDLGKDIRTEMNIEYVRMMLIHNGKEMDASLDWDIYSVKELYDWMRKGDELRTNLVPINEFINRFEPYLKKGMDILYLACSSALSGSISVSLLAKETLLEKYPDAKIICIDTLAGSMTEGMIVYNAALRKQEGMDINQVAEWVEKNKLKFNQFATVETLNYLKKAGRIKTSTAFFGNIFGVKPIFISDAHGNNYTIKKAKGKKASIEELINGVKETIEDPANQIVFVGHADDLEDGEYIKQRIMDEIKPKGVYINYIGPIVGTTCGPNTLATFCFGKEVTVFSEE